MARAVWKGGVSFGLVHIPAELYPAQSPSELKFTLLDRRDFSPVGYQRISKTSGKEVAWDDIVKGYEFEDGHYVVMSDEDFRIANVKATQTVEIFGFTEACTIAEQYFETPYVLVPAQRGEKGYALLCEALRRTGRAGLARVVIRGRQHYAAVVCDDDRLLVITLRYEEELRPIREHPVASSGERAHYSERELEMAQRLIADMEEAFDPSGFKDQYRDDLMRRIHEKVAAGQTRDLTAPAPSEPSESEPGASNVVDLMTLLQRSLADRAESPRERARKTSGGGADKNGRGKTGGATPARARRHQA